MAFTTINKKRLRDVLVSIREIEGESTMLLQLESILDFSTQEGSEVFINHQELDFILIYL